ncbi:MAG: transcriptional regulator [Legionellales bacterium]|nr:transcriptional regulator [Legionellales bacterium]
MNQQLAQAVKYWDYISPVIKQPGNQTEFEELVSELDELLEMVGDDEEHHLIGLVDIMSNLVSSYEEEHLPKIPTKGVDALAFLMQTHNLSQSDLSEIGSQGVVSEILHGKRELNLRQIKLLAQKFHVDISTFVDDD